MRRLRTPLSTTHLPWMNSTLLEDIQDDFPQPSTSIDGNENFTLFHEDHDFNATSGINGTAGGDQFEVPEISKFIDKNPWVVYVVIAGLTICVIAITALLFRNLCKNKKRVIRQDDDPVLTSTYDDGTSNPFYRLLCCRAKHDETARVRQNSESNLDPYKRPPLPPIGVKQDEFHYISSFASNDLTEPEKINASNIHAIRGVAHLPQRAEQYRQLPPLKL